MKLSIKDFNSYVNKSEDLGEKYELWQSYRRNINKIIEKALEKSESRENIIIFGAGSCNDIDLTFLMGKFKNIYLTDVDMNTMKEGLNRQGLAKEEGKRIKLLEVEYTGLGRLEFFEELTELLVNGAHVDKIIEFVNEGFENINYGEILKDYRERFSVAITAPIYSQLVLTQAGVILSSIQRLQIYGVKELQMIYGNIYDRLPQVIERYNDLLIDILIPGGTLIGLIDMLEATAEDELLKAVFSEDGEAMLEEQIKLQYNNPAVWGRRDIMRKTEKILSNWMEWPFSDKRHFVVYGYAGKKFE